MAIHVLDQHTAELIAAGEVVERPASVVKELAENAIDAGAGSIVVEIDKGGISRICVQDDGGGILSDEIPIAFLRHATSKVRTKEDLEAIATLGFRGEALASIASVSQIQLLSKTPEDEFASVYTIHGGVEIGLLPGARPVGTTITVENLFYNTPARMKFLKKDVSEGTFVSETVTRLALSHPEIAFRFVRDGKQVFSTPGDGKLQSAAYAVLGAGFSRDLLPVDGGNERYTVSGLITPPRGGRASRSMQFFFVNGRFVKNRTMMAALEQAYRGTMMQGKFPGAVLFMQMPADLVDVNVHPAKTEVRFARESDVFDAVYKACKSALMETGASHSSFKMPQPEEQHAVRAAIEGTAPKTPQPATTAAQNLPSGSFSAGGKPPVPQATHSRIQAYNNMVDTLASDTMAAPYQTATAPPPAPVKEWGLNIENDTPEEPLQRGNAAQAPQETAAPLPPQQETPAAPAAAILPLAEQTSFTLPAQEQASALRLVGEVFKTYIVAEVNNAICLIDKHAAHERILYEQLLAGRGKTSAQQLLSPVAVVLSAAEKTALLQNKEVLEEAGIELDDFGGNEVLLRAVPADVEPKSLEDLVIEVAQRLTLNSKDTMNEKTEWVLHSVACRAAVKAGDKTSPQELVKLAGDILEGIVPPFCPHGRPVVLEITRKELEKQFGRLG